MEKRSRRRIRDLVTQSASQGLSQNEIGCARISTMAKSTNARRRMSDTCAGCLSTVIHSKSQVCQSNLGTLQARAALRLYSLNQRVS
jgi:hypothetical protein